MVDKATEYLNNKRYYSNSYISSALLKSWIDSGIVEVDEVIENPDSSVLIRTNRCDVLLLKSLGTP